MPWLGSARGELSDWVTQRWVRVTGRHVSTDAERWLAGPTGSTDRIGDDFFDSYAQRAGLAVRNGVGLMPAFSALDGPGFDATKVDPRVRDFYENTARYEIDVESQWSPWFRPFGALVATLFSRRLEQLNVPRDSGAASHGMSSRVVHLVDPRSAGPVVTGWVRGDRAGAETVYVGAYALALVPARVDPCVKVVFPLPNGSATVFLRPSVAADGSLVLESSGDCFGDAGFYFVVENPDGAWVRQVRSFRERIHVFVGPDGALRTDHLFTLFRIAFLRLQYRLARSSGGVA
jgi:hypothetical protein